MSLPPGIRDGFRALVEVVSLVAEVTTPAAWVADGCLVTDGPPGTAPSHDLAPAPSSAVATLCYAVRCAARPDLVIGSVRQCLTLLHRLLPASNPALVQAMLAWDWAEVNGDTHGRMRALIRARAGDACEICDAPETPETRPGMSLLAPRFFGGTRRASNLAYLCPRCQQARKKLGHGIESWFAGLPQDLAEAFRSRLVKTGRWPLPSVPHGPPRAEPPGDGGDTDAGSRTVSSWAQERHARAIRANQPMFTLDPGRRYAPGLSQFLVPPVPSQYVALFRAVRGGTEPGGALDLLCASLLEWAERGCASPWQPLPLPPEARLETHLATAVRMAAQAAEKSHDAAATRERAWRSLAWLHGAIPAETPVLVEAVLAWDHAVGRHATPGLKALVRARAKDRCEVCGHQAREDGRNLLTGDHLVPWSLGGPTRALKLVYLCGKCNCAKGQKPPDEWLASLPEDVRPGVSSCLAGTGRWPARGHGLSGVSAGTPG
jgi:hypothetical protein